MLEDFAAEKKKKEWDEECKMKEEYGWNMRKLETLSAHLSRNCTCQLLLMPLQHAAKDKWDFDSCLTCMDFFATKLSLTSIEQ